MTLHTKISIAKSIIRIVGYLFLILAGVVTALQLGTALVISGILLLAAEILGILEEVFPGAYKGTDTESKPSRFDGPQRGVTY